MVVSVEDQTPDLINLNCHQENIQHLKYQGEKEIYSDERKLHIITNQWGYTQSGLSDSYNCPK